MTEVITRDEIQKALWDWAQLDQTRADAIMAMIDGWKLEPWTGDDIGSLLAALLGQLLDTGGRMRLDPAGQLDAPDNPLATRADVEALHKALRAPAKGSADVSELTNGVHATSVAVGKLAAALERIEARMADRLDAQAVAIAGLRLAVDERMSDSHWERQLANMMGAISQLGDSLREIAMTADEATGQEHLESLALLTSLKAQVEALTSTVLSAQRPVSLAELGRIITRAALDMEPLPADLERELLGAQPGAGEIFVEAIQLDEPARKKRERKPKEPEPLRAVPGSQPQYRLGFQPGCYFEPDGTIRCKNCGTAKDPSLFYHDRQSRTSYKSSCKDCERKKA